MLIDNRTLTGQPLALPRRHKVAVCCPSMDRVHADFMSSITGMIATSVTNGPIDAYMINHQNSVIADARNRLVSIALEWGADWLLWLDSDLQFPPDTLLRLMSHDLDIVGSTYCQRAAPYSIMGNFVDADKDKDWGDTILAETEYLPGGLVLAKAKVYEAVKAPWYEDYYNLETQRLIAAVRKWRTGGSSDLVQTELIAVFDKYDESNPTDRLGEDVDFCTKARAAGYKVWCDLVLTDAVTHIGQVHVRAKLPGRNPAEGPNIFVPQQAQAAE